MARERLAEGWQGVVRAAGLVELPVGRLAEHFSPDNGAPTKELHSMAGLIFLADFHGWDAVTAADHYMLDAGVQFALNLEPGVELCGRTVERYRSLLQEDEPAQGKLFAGLKDEEARQRGRQQVAEDMFAVIVKFGDVATINGRSSFKPLPRVFEEQVEVLEERVLVRKTTGGDVIQNPSDPDATYDGHQGAGYQIQLSETCSDQNEVRLIVGAIPETAVAHDGDALAPMLEQLHERHRLPEEMLADTTYGGDANVQHAETHGVELIAPICGRAPRTSADELTLDDFAHHEETGAVEACRRSHEPLDVTRKTVATNTPSGGVMTLTVTTVTMSAEHCESRPLLKLCPIQKQRDGHHRLEFTDKERRLAARRREESTPVFAERHAARSGIESTNSGLKN